MSTVATAVWNEKIRVLGREACLVVGLAGLCAIAAKLAIPIPWTPVPATLQVAVVIFAGCAFGAGRGALSMLVYLCAGFCGLPVFAPWTCAGPGVVLLPTFGYLLSFPAAAYLAGRWTRSKSRWLGAAEALGAIYLMGLFWLVGWAWATSHPVSATWALLSGMLPFLPLDLFKAAAAVWSAGPILSRRL